MHVLVTNEINEASLNEILIYCYLKLNKTLSLSYKFIKILKNEIVCVFFKDRREGRLMCFCFSVTKDFNRSMTLK